MCFGVSCKKYFLKLSDFSGLLFDFSPLSGYVQVKTNRDLADMVGKGAAGDLVESCLSNFSLVQTYKLESKLNFSSAITVCEE